MLPSNSRGLTPEENQRVCDAVRVLREKFGSQEAVARELVMPDGRPPAQGTVSLALRGQPVGVKFARAVANKVGITFEELISGQPAVPTGMRRNRDLIGWEDAARAVREQGVAPSYVVEAVGDTLPQLPIEPITSAMVFDQCIYWMKYAPLEVRKAAAAAELQREIEREDSERAEDEAHRRLVERSDTVARTDAATAPVLRAVPKAKGR